MPHPFGKDMTVEVIAAMPGARAPHVHVVTAPGLLVGRPSKEPIGVAFLAVISENISSLVDDLRLQVVHPRPVHDMWWRWYWNIVNAWHRWHSDRLIHLVDDKFGLVLTSSLVSRTAIALLVFIPQVLPIMETFVASAHESTAPNIPVPVIVANIGKLMRKNM